MQDIDVSWETELKQMPEPPCESPHRRTVCSVHVEWSRPASPCGCTPRHLACQASYDWMHKSCKEYLCSMCRAVFPAEEWWKGWYKV